MGGLFTAFLVAFGVLVAGACIGAIASALVMRRDRIHLTTDWQDEPRGEVLSPEEVVRRWV